MKKLLSILKPSGVVAAGGIAKKVKSPSIPPPPNMEPAKSGAGGPAGSKGK